MSEKAEKKKRHGSTNSRANSTGAVGEVGVDTVSVAYRTHDPEVWRRITEIAEAGEIVVAPPRWPQGRDPEPEQTIMVREGTFGSLALAVPVRSAQWRIYPRHHLIYWEGRLSAVASDDLSDHRLADPARLPMAAEAAARELERLTELPSGSLDLAEQEVRRLDLAAEVRFERTADGLAFLRALSVMTVPRRKVQIWRKGTRIETVSVHKLAGGLVLRAYDKGAERRQRGAEDAEAPGLRVRIERQHRWQRKDRKAPEQIATADHGAMWLYGFERWLDQAERLTIAPVADQTEAVLAAVEAGTMDLAGAERLLAAATIARHRGAEWWAEHGKPDTGRRRLAAAAKAGFALAADGEPATVPLAPTVRALRDAWR